MRQARVRSEEEEGGRLMSLRQGIPRCFARRSSPSPSPADQLHASICYSPSTWLIHARIKVHHHYASRPFVYSLISSNPKVGVSSSIVNSHISLTIHPNRHSIKGAGRQSEPLVIWEQQSKEMHMHRHIAACHFAAVGS